MNPISTPTEVIAVSEFVAQPLNEMPRQLQDLRDSIAGLGWTETEVDRFQRRARLVSAALPAYRAALRVDPKAEISGIDAASLPSVEEPE